MTIFISVIYWILLILSVGIIPLSLPGTFFIVGWNLLYQLLDSVPGINWRVVFILLSIAIILEVLEYLLTGWSSRRFGASRRGTLGAIVGSICGAIIGTGIVPFLGSLLGAFIGAFLGAFAVEYLARKTTHEAIWAGLGAFTGAVGGKMSKVIGAIVMLVIIAFQ